MNCVNSHMVRLNRETVLDALRDHRGALAEQFGVTGLALVGSFARDQATDTSDIDILVRFDGPATSKAYFGVQFIARVNRRFSHTKNGALTEKHHGLVVDYHGVSRELEDALAVFDDSDVQQALTELEDPGPVIQAAADSAEAHFRGLDLDDPWSCVRHFAADAATEGDYKADAYERFDRDYSDFSRLMDRYLPDPAALAYLDRLRRLTIIRSYTRAQFLRERADIDWTAVGAKVKQLLDSRIDASVRELMAPVSILDRDFEQKIESLPHDEARASLMEHALQAQINERIAENPALYERLSVALARIIGELRAKVIDAAEGCKRMAALRKQVTEEDTFAADQGLTPMSYAVYGLLARKREEGGSPPATSEHAELQPADIDAKVKEMALDIEEIVQRLDSLIDWHENLESQREVRRDIKRRLRAGRYDEGDVEELARQVMEMARKRRS